MERSAPKGALAPSSQCTALPAEGPSWIELLRHMHNAAYFCDAGGYIRYYNDAAADIWGRRPDVGREQWSGAYRLYFPDGTPLPLSRTPMARCLIERKPGHSAELVCERPDGTRRLLRVHPSPIFDAAGNLQGALNEFIDITDLATADKARAHLAAIVKTSDDAIISKNLNGIIQTWNQGAERLFGYSAEEAIGQSVTMLIPEDRIDEEPEVLAQIRVGNSVEHYETVRRRKDGSLVDISLTVSPIYDSCGDIVGASKIARDITHRKHAERSLAEAEGRKDEFIAVLAHELRNPLTPLTACLQLIRRDGYAGREIARGTFEMMERQVSHLNHLVGDLLDITRLTHGKIVLRKTSVSVKEVISDALVTVLPMMDSKEQRLELLADEELFIDGDRTRLVQILANLLNNAAKFACSKGRVQLAVDRQESFARLQVRDDGIGLAAENLEVIFNMFNRIHSPDVPEQPGMGIGLALVKKLVELHSGTIQVRSEGLGKGAEFTVLLPLSPQQEQPVTAPGPAATVAVQQRRVLIVDDNKDVADSIALLLQGVGHEVMTASGGIEALRVAKVFAPDVAILDLGLPDISGYDLATQLRDHQWEQRPVLVALTGWGSERDRQRSAGAGIDHHLLKPIEPKVLEDLVASARPARRN